MGARQRLRRLDARTCCLRPGILWLLVFYVVPEHPDVHQLVLVGHAGDGLHVLARELDDLHRRPRPYQPQFRRSLVYGAAATVICFLIAYPLAYTIAFRGGRYEEPPAVPRHRAVLHELPAADAELEDHPGRRRDPVRAAQGPRLPAARVPGPGHAGGGRRRHHLQLPAVHDAADLRLAREDRRPARRGRQGPVRRPVAPARHDRRRASSAGSLGRSWASRSTTRSSSSRRSARLVGAVVGRSSCPSRSSGSCSRCRCRASSPARC